MVHGAASVRMWPYGGGNILHNAHLDAGAPEGHSGILAKNGLPLLKCQSILRPGSVQQHLLRLYYTAGTWAHRLT